MVLPTCSTLYLEDMGSVAFSDSTSLGHLFFPWGFQAYEPIVEYAQGLEFPDLVLFSQKENAAVSLVLPQVLAGSFIAFFRLPIVYLPQRCEDWSCAVLHVMFLSMQFWAWALGSGLCPWGRGLMLHGSWLYWQRILLGSAWRVT